MNSRTKYVFVSTSVLLAVLLVFGLFILIPAVPPEPVHEELVPFGDVVTATVAFGISRILALVRGGESVLSILFLILMWHEVAHGPDFLNKDDGEPASAKVLPDEAAA